MKELFIVHPTEEVFPLLCLETLQDDISGVWMFPGHLLVATSARKSLVSFDARPKKGEEFGRIHLTNLKSSILDIVNNPSLPDRVLVVQCNGNVLCWEYSTANGWLMTTKFDLLTTQGVELVSVCLRPVDECMSTLYWCQLVSAETCSVCSKIMHQETTGDIQLGSVSEILTHAPRCSLYATESQLIATTGSDNLSIVLFWTSDSCTAYVNGDRSLELPDVKLTTKLDFCDLGMRLQPYIIQPQNKIQHWAVVFHSVAKNVLLIGDDGRIKKLPSSDEDLLSNVKLSSTSDSPSSHWSVINGCLANIKENRLSIRVSHYHNSGRLVFVLDKSMVPDLLMLNNKSVFESSAGHLVQLPSTFVHNLSVRLYDLITGHLIHVATVTKDIQDVCRGFNSSYHGFYTEKSIYCLQRKQFPESHLPDVDIGNKWFQVNALPIAYLDQNKGDGLVNLQHELSVSQESLLKKVEKHPEGRFYDIVMPYLMEYYKLEQATKRYFDVKSWTMEALFDKEINKIFSPTNTFPFHYRQAQLMLLADSNPDLLLATLLKLLDMEGALNPSESHVLAPDVNPISTKKVTNMPVFETMCRLFHRKKPTQLLPFVNVTKQSHDQTVGVLDFDRKKQTFYQRALQSLPTADASEDPYMVATVMTDLHLLSKSSGSVHKALEILLEYQNWERAITLLGQITNSSSIYTHLFSVTMETLAKHQQLERYSKQLSAILPNGLSFASLTSATRNNPLCDEKDSHIFPTSPGRSWTVGSFRHMYKRTMNE